ncbi:MAG: hypothetical protein K8823_1452 [Cenarchaeum symbiont of Oopsacas minuta]|nr:hypothetical protein [Cenarchaeum symbiont of Oopsacas minuta]
MSTDKVEFKMLDYKRIGDEVVVFKLEDGAIVKVKVDLGRVGKATKSTNPDGTPHYAINTSIMTSVIPPDKKFTVDKTQTKTTKSPPSQMFH